MARSQGAGQGGAARRQWRNKDGTAVRYLQLVHNEWDPATKSAKMRVLHNFGREDQVDKAAIERLAGSLCRLLDPGRAAVRREPGLSYSGSVAYGGPWLLDQLWQRPGIGAILAARLKATCRDACTERVLFALVANGRWTPRPSSRRRTGWAAGPGPAACPRPPTRATGRWTGCTRSRTR
jgi:hypothetical protein